MSFLRRTLSCSPPRINSLGAVGDRIDPVANPRISSHGGFQVGLLSSNRPTGTYPLRATSNNHLRLTRYLECKER